MPTGSGINTGTARLRRAAAEQGARRAAHWQLETMILAAVAYVVIGILFSVLSRSADADHVRLWRLAAWVARAAVAAAHIAYEHYRRSSSARATARRAAAPGAVGALGLALL